MSEFRIEKDSMGDVQVPAQAHYGAQTQRAVENFPISGWTLPRPLIRALGLVKLACATANRDLGKLTKTGKTKLTDQQIEKLLAACREVLEGKLDDQFPIDVFQTGSLGGQQLLGPASLTLKRSAGLILAWGQFGLGR